VSTNLANPRQSKTQVRFVIQQVCTSKPQQRLNLFSWRKHQVRWQWRNLWLKLSFMFKPEQNELDVEGAHMFGVLSWLTNAAILGFPSIVHQQCSLKTFMPF
jgi:hypothetical protein